MYLLFEQKVPPVLPCGNRTFLNTEPSAAKWFILWTGKSIVYMKQANQRIVTVFWKSVAKIFTKFLLWHVNATLYTTLQRYMLIVFPINVSKILYSGIASAFLSLYKTMKITHRKTRIIHASVSDTNKKKDTKYIPFVKGKIYFR